MQEYVHFFYICFADIPCLFFSTGRDQLLGRVGQKNIGPGISPRISPLNDFWVAGAAQPYLCPLSCFALYGWAKILVQVSKAIPVQVYDKKFKGLLTHRRKRPNAIMHILTNRTKAKFVIVRKCTF